MIEILACFVVGIVFSMVACAAACLLRIASAMEEIERKIK